MRTAQSATVRIGIFDHPRTSALRTAPSYIELLCLVDLPVAMPLQADPSRTINTSINNHLSAGGVFSNGDIQAARWHFLVVENVVLAANIALSLQMHEIL